jgi:hypothetical protein
VRPIWREVVAIAAATPACSRGRPETAAFVIGALTNPNPIPKIRYAAISRATGVSASMPTSSADATVRQTPAITSGMRGPRRPTIRPESGDATTIMSASGTVRRPACTGENPRVPWR